MNILIARTAYTYYWYSFFCVSVTVRNTIAQQVTVQHDFKWLSVNKYFKSYSICTLGYFRSRYLVILQNWCEQHLCKKSEYNYFVKTVSMGDQQTGDARVIRNVLRALVQELTFCFFLKTKQNLDLFINIHMKHFSNRDIILF